MTDETGPIVMHWGHWRRTVEWIDVGDEETAFTETLCAICGYLVPENVPLRAAMIAHDRTSHPKERWSQEFWWFLCDLRTQAGRLSFYAGRKAFQWPDLVLALRSTEYTTPEGYTDEEIELLGDKLDEMLRADELQRRRRANLYIGRERLIPFMEPTL